MSSEYEFALCLTHDVDRVTKTYQSVFYAAIDRDPSHLRSLLPGVNPYWQFEELMALEDDLGVRSACYFLNEPPIWEKPSETWVRPQYWIEHLGRYDVTSPKIVDAMRRLDAGGWEVGIHGSFDSYDDRESLRHEKAVLEDQLGHRVAGGRQHHLHLEIPETWQHHRDIGLQYDASLGSSTEYGFQHGYGVKRPFDDEFVVFPLTIMEVAVMRAASSVEAAWRECERLLREASENDAIMTVLWHPRYLNEREFPGYQRLYRQLVERALEMGAWVGPPGELYKRLDSSDSRPDYHGVGATC